MRFQALLYLRRVAGSRWCRSYRWASCLACILQNRPSVRWGQPGAEQGRFDRNKDDELSASERMLGTLTVGAGIGAAEAAAAEAQAQHEEERVKERLEELADEINAVQDEAGVSIDVQVGELNSDELREKYEELQDEEPEDEYSEAREQ